MMNPRTRRELIQAGVAGWAAGGAFAGLDGTALGASSPPETDVELAERLLATEQVVAFSYTHLLSSGIIEPALEPLLTQFAEHEQQHARAWEASVRALGGVVPAPPSSLEEADTALHELHVSSRLSDRRTLHQAIELLIGAEAGITGAYYIAIAQLEDPHLLVVAAQAMGAEAQHATTLRRLIHPRPVDRFVPSAFVQGYHK